jgi:hypothetical protein
MSIKNIFQMMQTLLLLPQLLILLLTRVNNSVNTQAKSNKSKNKKSYEISVRVMLSLLKTSIFMQEALAAETHLADELTLKLWLTTKVGKSNSPRG